MIGLTGLTLGISRGGLSGWGDGIVIGGLVVGAVLLPLFVLIERHGRAPMLDLSIFSDRLFAAASAAAFLNGLARFALMFVFVFYFQGAQGDGPVEAGVKLAPLALGMLVSSPLAGIWADRHGSRVLAAGGMAVTAAGLAAMTTLQPHTAYWQSAVWLGLVGIGSGMFNSPNTAAMMGTVPAQRRGVAAATRVLVQNTGAVISIAFVMAIITSSIDKTVLFKIFSGLTSGLSPEALAPFISNMHTALWVLAGDVRGRRPRLAAAPEPLDRAGHRAPGGRGGMTQETLLRIGDVAQQVGTTTRTIRYYEEIGLLPGSADRAAGAHRAYTAADVERLQHVLRLKELLGVSLDDLKLLVEAEDARAALRAEWDAGGAADDGGRRQEILREALGHVERQLALVEERRAEIDRLHADLAARRERLRARLDGREP